MVCDPLQSWVTGEIQPVPADLPHEWAWAEDTFLPVLNSS